MHNLTLLIPAKYEKDSLPLVLEELKNYDLKKLIVLERNDIETIEVTKKYECELLFQSVQGYGAALIEGIKKIETEYLCIFNADGSFNPNELRGMYNLVKKNSFVFATRYNNDSSSEDDTILTYMGNKIFSLIGKIFFSLDLNDILYTFVMGKTQKFKFIDLKSKDFKICVELPINIKKNNFQYVTNSSHERKRLMGEKKVNEFIDGFKILYFMIKSFFKKNY